MTNYLQLTDLHPDVQTKVLAKHPDFHQLPVGQQFDITRKFDRVAKATASKREQRALNKESAAKKGAANYAAAISAAEEKVAAKKAGRSQEKSTPDSATRVLKAPPSQELKELYQPSAYTPILANTQQNPAAENSLGYNRTHSDMLGSIGRRLEEHRLIHEGETDNVSDIGSKITDGFEALNHHDDAHIAGDPDAAKEYIKKAAQHFSEASTLLNHRYGNKYPGGKLPRVVPEGAPNEARFAMPLGDLAIHAANSYINIHRDTVQDGGRKYNGRTSIAGRTMRYIADEVKLANPGKKGDYVKGSTSEAAEKAPEPAPYKFTLDEDAINKRVQEKLAARQAAAPKPAAAPARPAPTRVTGEGARYLGTAGHFKFGKSGTPRVNTENRVAAVDDLTTALTSLRKGEPVHPDIRTALGSFGMEQVKKAHRAYLESQSANADEQPDNEAQSRRGFLDQGMGEGKG